MTEILKTNPDYETLRLTVFIIGAVLSVLLSVVAFFLKKQIEIQETLAKAVNNLTVAVTVLENQNRDRHPGYRAPGLVCKKYKIETFAQSVIQYNSCDCENSLATITVLPGKAWDGVKLGCPNDAEEPVGGSTYSIVHSTSVPVILSGDAIVTCIGIATGEDGGGDCGVN